MSAGVYLSPASCDSLWVWRREENSRVSARPSQPCSQRGPLRALGCVGKLPNNHLMGTAFHQAGDLRALCPILLLFEC